MSIKKLLALGFFGQSGALDQGVYYSVRPTYTGFNAATGEPVSNGSFRFAVKGKFCHFYYSANFAAGASNGTGLVSVTLPLAAARSGKQTFNAGTYFNNGVVPLTSVLLETTAGSNIANLFHNNGLTTFSGNLWFYLNGFYEISSEVQKQVFFEGNSLFNNRAGVNASGGYYCAIKTYQNSAATKDIVFFSRAIGGQTQTQINANIATKITPFVRRGDVIVLWEGTNDLSVNALTGAQAYANLVTYANTVRALGAKLIICTVIARDFTTDAADLMDRIDDYNELVRANQSSICDALCDLAADPLFDTRADASNTTYYLADKLHQTQVGQDYIAGLISTTLNTLV